MNKEKTLYPIYSIGFHPSGSKMVACCGTRILVYDVASGELVKTLKGHKGIVYCVDFSADGRQLASGGSDKMVIIWNEKMEPLLKYNHGDTIQTVGHCPLGNLVLSCSASDFGFGSADVRSVNKFKVMYETAWY